MGFLHVTPSGFLVCVTPFVSSQVMRNPSFIFWSVVCASVLLHALHKTEIWKIEYFELIAGFQCHAIQNRSK